MLSILVCGDVPFDPQSMHYMPSLNMDGSSIPHG
jgi:hypothetical protein